MRTRTADGDRIAFSVPMALRGEETPPRAADESRGAGSDGADELVERLREELEAARRHVREAWARYQREARDPKLPAIAAAPLLPALMALMQQCS
jgi:hypothetical protein